MATRSQGREHRVADFLQRELAVLLRQEVRDPRVGLVTVNEVRVSRDLGYADIYVSQLNASHIDHEQEESREALLKALNGASGYLRTLLSRAATMRSVPKLRFRYDEAIENGMRMDQKIREAVQSDRELAERAGEGSPDAAAAGAGAPGDGAPGDEVAR